MSNEMHQHLRPKQTTPLVLYIFWDRFQAALVTLKQFFFSGHALPSHSPLTDRLALCIFLENAAVTQAPSTTHTAGVCS